MKKIPMPSGTIFSDLTLLERIADGKSQHHRYLCSCKCGNVIVASGHDLRSGKIHQCRVCSYKSRSKGPNRVEHRSDGTVTIFLERKNQKDLECVIDATDYTLVKGYRWFPRVPRNPKHMPYAQTFVTRPSGEKTTIQLHSLLLPDASEVDHKDGNGLNNRRFNLRPATSSQNKVNQTQRGRSKYRGVRLEGANYRATVYWQGKKIIIGSFTNAEEAARARDAAALKYQGEFARLNFPKEILSVSDAVLAAEQAGAQ